MNSFKTTALILIASTFANQTQAQFGTGLMLDPKSSFHLSSFPKSFGFSNAEPPATYSMRPYAPYVKSQDIYPSCAGWAVSYEAYSIQTAMALGISNRNHVTAKAFCPYFSYNKVETPDPFCKSGRDAGKMIINLQNIGAKKFYLPLMGCGSSFTNEFDYATQYHKISKSYELKLYNPEDFAGVTDIDGFFKQFFTGNKLMDISFMKKLVSNNYPVIIGMALPNSFYNAGADWAPTYQEASDPAAAIKGNTGMHAMHCMTIIGYDDTRNGGSFEVMNSWSEGWGEKGFVYIKYEDLKKFVFGAFVMDLAPLAADISYKSGVLYGDCQNGYGSYRFTNGHTYEGQWKSDKFDGYGIYTWPNGCAYAGQWKDGKRHGEATVYYVGGTFGQATFDNDTFVSGYNEYLYTNGNTYKGYLKNGKFDGAGEFRFAEGHRYSAIFSNGNLNGPGKFENANGTIFIGYYLNGRKHGKGVVVTNTGAIAAGEWQYDKFMTGKSFGYAGVNLGASGSQMSSASYLSADCVSGNCMTDEGKKVMSNGATYIGNFSDGLYDGKGEFTSANVSVKGSWRQGNMNGICEYTDSYGTTRLGEFKMSKLDGYVLVFDKSGNMAVELWSNGAKISTYNQINSSSSAAAGFKLPASSSSIGLQVTPLK